MLNKMNKKGKKAKKKKSFTSEAHRSLNEYTMTIYCYSDLKRMFFLSLTIL